jgi:hypothetical protein
VFRAGTAVLVPVVMGSSDTVGIRIRHCGALGLFSAVQEEIWYPGKDQPIIRKVAVGADELNLNTPLERGCAFLVLRR